MLLAMRKGGARKPSPAFLRAAARTGSAASPVSEALLKQARKSGQLNLSNRSLDVRELALGFGILPGL